VSPERAQEALEDLLVLPVKQHLFQPLAHRVWSFRHQLTAYDAAYVAVAENLGHVLCTTDRRLASVPGLRCQVEVL
jgi:predicted nucleic acid-binding protein